MKYTTYEIGSKLISVGSKTALLTLSCYLLYDTFNPYGFIVGYQVYDMNESKGFVVGIVGKNAFVDVRHQGINCLRDKGYPISLSSSEIKFDGYNPRHGATQTTNVAFESKTKFKFDCKECNTKTMIMYKNIFGQRIFKQIEWASEIN